MITNPQNQAHQIKFVIIVLISVSIVRGREQACLIDATWGLYFCCAFNPFPVNRKTWWYISIRGKRV